MISMTCIPASVFPGRCILHSGSSGSRAFWQPRSHLIQLTALHSRIPSCYKGVPGPPALLDSCSAKQKIAKYVNESQICLNSCW